jgi:hypothetical protein
VLILLAAVVVLLLVPGIGGRWRSVLDLPLAGAWLLGTSMGIQVLTISVVPDGPDALYRILHLGSYGLVGLFIWWNRWIPWLWLAALGGASNAAAIAVNGGVMPASASALRSVGRAAETGFVNSGAVPHPRLLVLGDVFATPSWMPLANVFSIGDLVLVTGFVLLVASASRRPTERTITQARELAEVMTSVLDALADLRAEGAKTMELLQRRGATAGPFNHT